MIALLRKLDSSVKIQAELEIEVESLMFYLSVNDKEALVKVDRWRDALVLLHHLHSPQKSIKQTFAALDEELKRLGITIYIRRRSVAVMGLKANPLFGFMIKSIIPFFSRD